MEMLALNVSVSNECGSKLGIVKLLNPRHMIGKLSETTECE
jgi:hypothetical protein